MFRNTVCCGPALELLSPYHRLSALCPPLLCFLMPDSPVQKWHHKPLVHELENSALFSSLIHPHEREFF